jgi:Domain of unknown function (DUF4397)
MMTHRAPVALIRRLLAPCALALAMLSTAGPAAAASAAAPAAGWLRLANLSPGTPTFDIYLYQVGNTHARLVLRNVGYGMVSGYETVPAADYTVALRRAGEPAGSLPLLSATVSVAGGHAYTLASTGPSSAPRLELLPDARSAPKGKALVRVIQASLRQTRVTLTAGRHVLVRNLAFGSATSFAAVPPGTRTVRAAGQTMTTAQRETWTAGSTYTLVVLDGAGGLQLDCLMDEAGSRMQPAGGAMLGFGGTAPQPGSRLPWLAAMACGALLAGAGGLWLRRARAVT